MKHELLIPEDLLCFKCKYPPDACGLNTTRCKFMQATRDGINKRRRTVKKQGSCGVPLPDERLNLWGDE